MEDKTVFSKNLRLIRERKNLSAKDIAIRAGLNPSSLAYYECTTRNPNIESVQKIAKALNVRVSELIEEDAAIFRNEKKKATMFNCIMRDAEIMSMSDKDFRKRVEEYIRLYKQERE